MADGQVVFEISADGKRAIAQIDDVTRAIEKAGKDWDASVDKSSANMTKSMAQAFDIERVKNWSIQAAKAMIGFAEDAVRAASDLEEVQNVVDTTFGANANQIDTWAKNAATQFGLTETQAKRFTSTLGAMMKSAGMAGPEIVNMSEDLAGLAADMASFYNLDFDTAFQKIRAGISGEVEPLRQLGINMSSANLEAYALTQGITKAFDKMSQGEQTMLRYQYLMQATADAQGDFARTSDGYANSLRMLQTNIENIKTSVGTFLIPALSDAVGFINDAIGAITQPKPTTVLDEIAAIDLKSEEKINQIHEVAAEAEALIDMLEELSGATISDGEEDDPDSGIKGRLLALGNESQEAIEGLKALGMTSDEIDDAQSKWLETCRRLVQTIPGLNSIINTQTGEIEGGTEAVEEYVKAWADMQETQARLEALYQKRDALEQGADLSGKWADMQLWQNRVKRISDEINALGATTGQAIDYARGGPTLFESEARKKIRLLGKELVEATSESERATKAYTDAERDLNTAMKDLQPSIDAEIAALEASGVTAEGVSESYVTLSETGKMAAAALSDALTAAADYAAATRTSTIKDISGIVGGLKSVETPAQKARKELINLNNEIYELNQAGKDSSGLEKTWESVAEGIPTMQNMTKALRDQVEYMREYQQNLEIAAAKGVNADLLAQLSDGSAESADYLAEIAEATDAEIMELNDAYMAREKEAQAFADSLTESKLAADETYQGLIDTADAAMQALDKESEANLAGANTMRGLVSGLESLRPVLQDEIDAIISQLDRLSSFGAVSYSNGSISFGTAISGSHAAGLDWVPFNNYLAALHEGESVLTAEEARMWRAYKDGVMGTRNSLDYGKMAGAIWDQAPSIGGNVYLDGRTVGRVMSAQQASAYRQLERSGWQG